MRQLCHHGRALNQRWHLEPSHFVGSRLLCCRPVHHHRVLTGAVYTVCKSTAASSIHVQTVLRDVRAVHALFLMKLMQLIRTYPFRAWWKHPAGFGQGKMLAAVVLEQCNYLSASQTIWQVPRQYSSNAPYLWVPGLQNSSCLSSKRH